jgi:hypothetical protein
VACTSESSCRLAWCLCAGASRIKQGHTLNWPIIFLLQSMEKDRSFVGLWTALPLTRWSIIAVRRVGRRYLTMLRRTMPTLEALALRKPGHEKVTSLREDMAQPPMIGSSDPHTASGGYACPSNGADSSTENTCRQDLMSLDLNAHGRPVHLKHTLHSGRLTVSPPALLISRCGRS